MSARDPFLRALLVVLDRTIVFLVLCALVCALLWEFVCTRGLGMNDLDALRGALALMRGDAAPVIAVAFGLTATVSVLASGIVSAVLFGIWRRRARVASGQVRGPLSDRWDP
jgi:hypothetical protein